MRKCEKAKEKPKMRECEKSEKTDWRWSRTGWELGRNRKSSYSYSLESTQLACRVAERKTGDGRNNQMKM